MESTIKIASIGAGAWGKNIVRTLHGLGNLAMVAEAADSLRASLLKDYPALEVVADYGDMLQREEISAVTIATPAPTHHAIAKACLAAGKDVFVEKPMTMSSAEAQDLIDLAQAKGRVLMVGHLLLYKPAVEFIRDYLAEGQLGKVYSLHQERAKLGKARAVENALWSLGVHDVAALLYIVGTAPVEVQFSGHCGLQSSIDDDTYLHMTFASGTKAHLHNSWLWPEDRRALVVVGGRGMLVYDEKAEKVSLVRKTVDSALNNVDEGSEVLFEAPANYQALTAEMAHFIHCVEKRQQPRSCGQNGLDVVRVLEAAKAYTS
jgi:predicted dehydrogenase